jgi:predicted transcriptional regulator
MARIRRQTRAELLRAACEENYEGYTQESTKEEIARISKVNFSLVEDKKDTVKAMNEVIKENVDKIEYLVEKLDALRHEDAVANQLDQVG